MVGQILHKDLGAMELARKPSGNNGHIVLAVIPRRAEFVTWWLSSEEDVAVCGHYHTDLAAAMEDFADRY